MAARAPTTRQRAPQKRAEETRQRLLEAAVEMFSTVGFEGTTAAALEEVAGVQRGLMAYHFGSKDALWRLAVDRAFDRSETATRELFAAEFPARGDDRLGALIAAYVRANARHPQMLNLIMREAMVESDRRDYIAERHVSRLADIIAMLTGRPRSPHDFYALVGAMSFVFVSPAGARQIWKTEPFSEAFIEKHAEVVAEIFRNSWGPGASG